MLRNLRALDDTSTVGEHLLQYAAELTASPDLDPRAISEDMVGLRNAANRINREEEVGVSVSGGDVSAASREHCRAPRAAT